MFKPQPWTAPANTAARCLAETLAKAAALLASADAVAAHAGQAGTVRALAKELGELAAKLDPTIQLVDGAEPVPQLRISAAA
jgi:hypothetical protein